MKPVTMQIRAEWRLAILNERMRDRLSQLRQQGKTITWFIKTSGISETYVFLWIKGERQLERFETVYRAMVALGMNLTIRE